MSWFKRIKKNIVTKKKKKNIPENIWYKCKKCQTTMPSKAHYENSYVCPKCDSHDRIGSTQYFNLLFDNADYRILFDNLSSKDILNFKDKKTYKERLKKEKLKETKYKVQLEDAIQVATGKINALPLTIAAMDFEFIGGSMGSLVGEKIARAIDFCIQNRLPLLIISKSGGARMMESAFSLMQMAKTSAKLSQLSEAKLPYISLLTDPTTGGVSASYAMLGDLNIAEPDALIGFAGPRVIKETIHRDLPKGFQRSEFLLERGFLDLIVHRKDLKNKLSELFGYLI